MAYLRYVISNDFGMEQHFLFFRFILNLYLTGEQFEKNNLFKNNLKQIVQKTEKLDILGSYLLEEVK